MKKIRFKFFGFLVLCLLVPSLALRAQYAPTITIGSTADDILAAVDQVAQTQLSESPDKNGFSPQTSQFTKSLNVVDHKVLIDAFMRLPADATGDNAKRYNLETAMFETAMRTGLTPADIPNLLSVDDPNDRKHRKSECLNFIVNRNWADDSAVPPFLLTALQQAQDTTPNMHADDTWVVILNLLRFNHDPKVADALAALVTKLTSDPNFDKLDGPQYQFINAITSGLCRQGDSHAKLLIPCLSALIKSRQNNTSQDYPIIGTLTEALENHQSELLADPDFVAAATAYLRKPVQFPAPTTAIDLAYLGDSEGFAQAIANYFQPPAGPSGNPMPQGELQMMAAKGNNLIATVLYSGPGSKIDALRDHAKEAVFQKGWWFLTMPGSPPPTIPSSSGASMLTATSTPGDILAESDRLGRNGANDDRTPGYSPEPEAEFFKQVQDRDHTSLIAAYLGTPNERSMDRGVLFRSLRKILTPADLPYLTQALNQAASDPNFTGTQIPGRLKQIIQEITKAAKADPSRAQPATPAPTPNAPPG